MRTLKRLLGSDLDFQDYSAFAALFRCLAVGLIFVVSLAGVPGRAPAAPNVARSRISVQMADGLGDWRCIAND